MTKKTNRISVRLYQFCVWCFLRGKRQGIRVETAGECLTTARQQAAQFVCEMLGLTAEQVTGVTLIPCQRRVA